METEYRFWIRERGRSRNKWHVSIEYLRPSKVGDLHVFDLGPYDISACGEGFGNISAATHETQELPSGQLPTDPHGVCLHCLRWVETENRKEEAQTTTTISINMDHHVPAVNALLRKTYGNAQQTR